MSHFIQLHQYDDLSKEVVVNVDLICFLRQGIDGKGNLFTSIFLSGYTDRLEVSETPSDITNMIRRSECNDTQEARTDKR